MTWKLVVDRGRNGWNLMDGSDQIVASVRHSREHRNKFFWWLTNGAADLALTEEAAKSAVEKRLAALRAARSQP